MAGIMPVIIVAVIVAFSCAVSCVCAFWKLRRRHRDGDSAATAKPCTTSAGSQERGSVPPTEVSQGPRLPSYWSGLQPPLVQGWRLGIPDSDTLKSLAGLLHVAEPSELGKGRDAKGYPRPYNHLEFFAAWRVEHAALWKSYEAKKDEIAQRMTNLARHAACGRTPEVTPALPGRGSASLPGGPDLNRSINEAFLLCGTPPENVLAIIDQGLNSNISKMDGLLGPGIYFAERPEKMDQYTRPDSTFKKAGLEQLHARLFRGAFGIKHPGEDLFYCLVVRVALGWPAHTKDGTTCLENATPVFHGDDKRELAHVPLKPSGPLSVPYHSLVCEAGAGCYLQRFREFVIKGNPQCYVEYVVAYKRTMKL